MATELNLIDTNFQEIEKRVLPRFPLNFLLFKRREGEHAFEVCDISYTGMQIAVKDQEPLFLEGKRVEGTIHWRGPKLDIVATIQWKQDGRVGLAFVIDDKFKQNIRNFLSYENIVAGMRCLHKSAIELPVGLKYWLRSEGPVEIFVWKSGNGAISKVQFIFLDSFVEWEDGTGLRSGKILTQRDSSLPLGMDGEFIFEIDSRNEASKLQFCRDLLNALPDDFLPDEVVAFILRKL